ncbi:hypothetical protein HAX54_007035 [Datura stramonium]|uniref:Uncharacterized protein n=1 Tax=Datura stramonium TaxID=4076 RepID=A0ABS8TCB6_DATST|nr:hypothetical protein [Datura stramonium]
MDPSSVSADELIRINTATTSGSTVKLNGISNRLYNLHCPCNNFDSVGGSFLIATHQYLLIVEKAGVKWKQDAAHTLALASWCYSVSDFEGFPKDYLGDWQGGMLIDEQGRPDIQFVEGCKRWIEEAQMLAKSDDSTTRRILHEVVQQYTKKQRDEIAEIEQLMAKILKHVENQALEAEHILKDDGNPNIERV